MAFDVATHLPMLSRYWLHIIAAVAGYFLFSAIKNAVLTTRKPGGKSRGKLDSYDLSLISEDLTESDLVETHEEATDHNEDDVEQIPYVNDRYSPEETITRSAEFYRAINRRRTVRHFSEKPVPLETIQNVIKSAGTSPSGAHMQPWTFVVIEDPDLKCEIRSIVEAEEEINYRQRMGDKWVNDLAPLRVNWEKPYLEKAPYLILAFEQVHGLTKDGKKQPHYYSRISASIACGILLTALQNAGLCTVTSTPLNAGPTIRQLVQRPSSEKLLLLLPVGYPADDCLVPDLKRKPLEDIMILI